MRTSFSSTSISYTITDNAFAGSSTITVTYTTGQKLTITLGTPSGLNSPSPTNGGKTLSVATDSSYGIVVNSDGKIAKSSAVDGTWPITGWSFKGTNQSTVTNSTQVSISFTKPSTCVTADTLVTLANGTQKRIDKLEYSDMLLVWDFDRGVYTQISASIIENHGYGENVVITLTFEDGTVVKAVNVHGFFDADLNKWVDINAENVQSFIGHSFVKVDGDGYTTTRLECADVSVEYTEAWSVLSIGYYNCIIEGMFTITPPATEQLAFFDIGADMKYDAEAKQSDIDRYGLYTYEEFAHLMSKEAFDALNIAQIKIAVGKGLITYDEVLALISIYA